MKNKIQIFLSLILLLCGKTIHQKKKKRVIDNYLTDYSKLNIKNNNPVNLMIIDGKGHLKRETINPSDLKRVTKLCLPSSSDYSLCQTISSCSTCAHIPHCGWCEHSQRCISANDQGQICEGDCLNGWIFEQFRCKSDPKEGQILAGQFSNIAKDASTINPAKIVDNSDLIRVNTIEQQYHKNKKDNQVGTVATMLHHVIDDQQITQISRSPLIATQIVNIPIGNPVVTSTLYNVTNNQVVQQKPSRKDYHGLEPNLKAKVNLIYDDFYQSTQNLKRFRKIQHK